MKKIILLSWLYLTGLISYGQIIITELADPDDNSSARFVELYNLGSSTVDFSTGWKINRYTNGNADPQTAASLTGTIAAGGFYIISNDATEFTSVYGFAPDQDLGGGGSADSNGDDQIFLINDSDEIVDFFGVVGEDGTGTCHEFEDGRAERLATVTTGVSTYDESEWNLWADSGGTGCTNFTVEAQDASDMDPGFWIGQPATSNPEPTNHVASFTATVAGAAQIDLSWSDNDGTDEAEGFIIFASTGSITGPTDGTEEVVDNDLSDGSAIVEVVTDAESYSFSSLTPSTTYNFEIYPYSNFGENIDYKTDGTVPSQSVTTSASTFSDGDIVISEIMYNSDGEDADWIEIYNNSGSTISLDSDWELSNTNGAWSYTFDGTLSINDGEYKSIGIRLTSSATFPFTPDLDLSGESLSTLQNTSSTITLKAEGVTIDEVFYEDDIENTDNVGYSLSLGDLDADNSDITNWIGSAVIDGTPGAANDVTSWTGASSTEWATVGNWSNGVPSSSMSAIIPMEANEPTLADDAEVASFKVISDATLTINAGTLAINDEFIMDGAVEVMSGASLAILGDETGSGESLTIHRNTMGSAGYSILGAPVFGTSVENLSADYLYEYDEASSEFSVPTGTMTPGVGYFVGYNAASPSASFTGAPVTSTVTTAVTVDGDGFAIVANPYAAAISISEFQTANSSIIDGTVYFWDDGGANVGANRGGDYITVNNMGTTSVDNLSDGVDGAQGTSAAENAHIASVQGFVVQATSAGNVTFTTDMQVTTSGANTDANHYRETEPEEYQTIALSISGNGLYNELLVGLAENATFGRDYGLDSEKFSGNDLISFYSIQEDLKYAIQGLPFVNTETVSTSLGMDLAEAGDYTFSVESLNNIPSKVEVKLTDLVTGLSYDLKSDESFSFSSEVVSDVSRFQLTFAPSEVLSTEILLADQLKVYGNSSQLTLEYSKLDEGVVKIYNLSGKVILSETVDFSNQIADIPVNLKNNQLYILRLNGESLKFKLQ